MAGKSRGFLVFRVGPEWYGFAVGDIIEVLHMVALNEIPGSDILGAMTLRDHVVSVIDLRARFGLTELEFKLDTPILVVNTSQGGLGLVVDEADQVVMVAAEALDAFSAEFVNGSFRHNGHPVFVIDMARLMPVIYPPDNQQPE